MRALVLVLSSLSLAASKRPPLTLREKRSRLVKASETPTLVATSDDPLRLNALELCLCGAVSTMIGDFVMHPVDTIKIVQQTSSSALSFLSAASQIFRARGIPGFFPGVGPYLLCDGISGAIKFATFEVSKVLVERRIPLQYHPMAQFVCAAGLLKPCDGLAAT